MPRSRTGLLAAAAAMAVLALSGCSSGSGSGGTGGTAAPAATTTTAAPAPTTTTAAPAAAAASTELTAQGIAFHPTKLSFSSGGKVSFTFKNLDSVEHNFTLEGVSGVKKDLEAGKTITVSFAAPKPGTYKFHCEYHPKLMKGTVTIT